MPLVATGGPGTHLIDLYPMVYNGQDRKAWYWAPVLTFARDFPRWVWATDCPRTAWPSRSASNCSSSED